MKDTVNIPGNQDGANWNKTAANPGKGIVCVMNVNEPAILRMSVEAPRRRPGCGANRAVSCSEVQGRAVYRHYCQEWHGADLSGNGNHPSLVDITSRVGADTVRSTVSGGRGPMPAFSSDIKEADMNLPLPYHISSGASAAKVRSTSVRETNIRDLLRLLRLHSPCSRADLTRLSGLTAPTVSAGISRLQRLGLVTTLGQASSNGGRPPGLLEFNARHGYVVGVDIGGSHLGIVMADLNGTIVGRGTTIFRAERRPKAVTEMIADGIKRISQQQKVPMSKILHIAVGAPGITDVAAGRVLSAYSLTDWHDVPLRDLVEEKTRISTTVDNDVNLSALGEAWCGAARNVANFIFLAIGTGVGAGIVVNGTLHHGANWSAGEVGYMLLPGLRSDPPLIDGAGALESAVGGQSVREAWIGQTGSAPSVQAPLATEIFDLAATGDSVGREILSRVAEHLAMAITNLSLVLDLSLVVLGGGVGYHPGLLRAIEKRLERNQFARPQLIVSGLNGEAQIYGAIWLALQAVEAQDFRNPGPQDKKESARAMAADR